MENTTQASASVAIIQFPQTDLAHIFLPQRIFPLYFSLLYIIRCDLALAQGWICPTKRFRYVYEESMEFSLYECKKKKKNEEKSLHLTYPSNCLSTYFTGKHLMLN